MKKMVVICFKKKKGDTCQLPARSDTNPSDATAKKKDIGIFPENGSDCIRES